VTALGLRMHTESTGWTVIPDPCVNERKHSRRRKDHKRTIRSPHPVAANSPAGPPLATLTENTQLGCTIVPLLVRAAPTATPSALSSSMSGSGHT
jgi:hypothetical protein